jgi:hypothetical protein
MDPGGHLRLWLMRYFAENLTDVRWISRSTLWGVFPQPREFTELDTVTRLRLQRLIGALCDLRRGETVPLVVRGFAEAALIGATGRALLIVDLWVAGKEMPAWLEARCMQSQRHLSRRISTVLLSAREGVGGLWLLDLPSPILPFAVAHHRQMFGARNWLVHSGGDRLNPGIWTWTIDTTGEGEVLRRSQAVFTPFKCANAHREAFEPTTGGVA